MDAAVLLEILTRWITDNPGWAGWLVFLIALGESLAIVGLFVPGVVLMFVVGALVGSGVMPLWPTLAWAAAGAVAGDGVSYWLGRHYHDRLRQIWPFSRYPGLIQKGEAFFRKHGGKGILFGRFVGPVRPVVPLVAGMMDMPAWRFALINVLSALLWAPAYILPGAVFSSSLSMATEVAGRLAVLLLLLFSVVLLTVWLVRRLFWVLQPRVNPVISRILDWSRHHPLMGDVAEALLDPNHPEARGLAILSVMLFLTLLILVLLVASLQQSRLLGNVDLLVFNALQSLRTPWADQWMVFATGFGSRWNVAGLVLLVSFWLVWRKNWRAAVHLLAVIWITEMTVLVMKAVTGIERPFLFYGGVDQFSFPSEHSALAVAAYGMLAIIVAGAVPASWRWLPYAAAGMTAVVVGFSRIYLGAQWLSDVLGGLGIGVAWASLVGIAYRRHSLPRSGSTGFGDRVDLRPLVLVIGGGLSTIAVLQWSQLDEQTKRYLPERSIQHLSARSWWESEWERLPAYRADLRSLRDHPFTIQWAGPLSKIREFLQQEGWQTPALLDFSRMLELLASETEPERLPVLPQVNDGRHESLRLVLPMGGNEILVLRLWPTDWILTPGEIPLWQGNVTYLEFSRLAGLLLVGRTSPEFDAPLADFIAALKGRKEVVYRLVYRHAGNRERAGWEGELILIRFAGSPAFPTVVESVPAAAGDR